MSPLFDSGSGRPPRVPLLGAFLVMTVGLAVWLGYEAVAAAGSHRQTAEAVLRDYAGIALSSFTRSTRDELDEALDAVFHPVHHDLAGMDRIPSPIFLGWELDDAARAAGCRRSCTAIQSPIVLFSADLETREVRAYPDTFQVGRLRALADTISASRVDIEADDNDDGFLVAGGDRFFDDSVSVGYTVARDSVGRSRVLGFVTPVEGLTQLFEEWYDDIRFLPDPIGDDQPSDSLLHVTVRGRDGTTVFASPAEYPMTLSATESLGPEYDDMTVEVTMRPDQASQLIIGGLPNSRIPLLVGLLILTLGVGVAALVQLRQELEFQRLRNDFVSGVSHELRTPLAQIRMFAELQGDGKLSSAADQARAVSVINREARRLSHLVDNILQFSKLRHAGRSALPKEDLDLSEALEDGVDAMTSLLRDRSMSLRVEAEPGLRVHANRDALTRIVVNLLDNAAKYGPEGQKVRVAVERVDGVARLSVTDEGPGVPPTERGRIWKAYRRLERDVKARKPGTGIGLSVVYELAEMHGGRARVENAEGGGARFIVELPLALDAGADSDADASDGREGGGAPGEPVTDASSAGPRPERGLAATPGER